MEEIRQLQRELGDVLRQDSANRLSDRNVIEIVAKLADLQLINVVFTLDGKEYVTQDQLEREISDELFVRGGRVLLTDLQPELNVDLRHIEVKTEALLQKDANVNLIQGELISGIYLDKMAEEINETLHQTGQVMIADLAMRFSLPVVFLIQAITERLGTRIFGTLENEKLCTQDYLDRMFAVTRGYCSAVIRPTSISQVAALTKLANESATLANINKMLQNERLTGSIGSRRTFTPAIYSRMRKHYVESFFAQNGFIELVTLVDLEIVEPERFAKGLGQGYLLETCFLAAAMFDNALAETEDALSTHGAGWVETASLLSLSLTKGDVGKLTGLLAHALPDEPSVVADQYLVSKRLIKDVLGDFEQAAQREAQAGTLKPKATKDSEPTRPASKKAGAKSGGKKQKGATASEDVEERRSQSDDGSALPLDEMNAFIRSGRPSLPREITSEIATLLRKPVAEVRSGLMRQVLRETTQQQRSADPGWQDRISLAYYTLLVYQKGAKIVPATTDAMDKHMAKTLCGDFVGDLLRILCARMNVSFEDSLERTIEHFPDEMKQPLTVLISATKGTLSGFCTEFLDHCGAFEVRVKGVCDKKTERKILESQIETLHAQLSENTTAPSVLHLAVVYLYALGRDSLVHPPGKLLATMISALENQIPAEIFEGLRRFHGQVVNLLKNPDNIVSESDVRDFKTLMFTLTKT